MRLSIHHQTRYRFSAPQGRLVQMLRLTPENTHDQTVASWRIDVDCDARLRSARDGFGNLVTMLYAAGPIDTVEIAVVGEVLTSHSDGVLHGVAEIHAPDLFRRSTPATAADEAIARWAADVAGDREPLAALHALNHALHDRPTRDDDAPPRDAAAAFAADAVTARELAQLFVAAARALGQPARYVSGYALLGTDHHPAPHGWGEAWVKGLGWIGFDPSIGFSPEERHVRVAVALDAAGAAPVAGSRLGIGDERLEVDVSVEQAG